MEQEQPLDLPDGEQPEIDPQGTIDQFALAELYITSLFERVVVKREGSKVEHL